MHRLSLLRVIARTSVMHRSTTTPLSRIAAELGVDAIVEGSVARAGDRVRITAQLVDGSTDSHLWADSYHRDVRDVLALQRDVAEAIAGAVRAELSGSDARVRPAPRPVDPESFDRYLRGRHACTMRQPPEEIRRGVGLLRDAIARDPDYPQAHAALAACYLVLGTVLTGEPPQESRTQAAASARAALALDDGLAQAHASLATINMREWNWQHSAESLAT